MVVGLARAGLGGVDGAGEGLVQVGLEGAGEGSVAEAVAGVGVEEVAAY